MTPEALSGLAGAALSLLMSYVPGLNTWYAARSSTAKQGLMAVMIALSATGSTIWACHGSGLAECAGGLDWRAWVQSVLAALVANQGTHRISPTTDAVKAAQPPAETPKPRRRRKPTAKGDPS